MALITGKHTKPELMVRRLLSSAGFRYRLHAQDLPGRPDIVFRKARKAIFVHGCFWHGHDNCKVAHLPKSRTAFWAEKFAKNRARDTRNQTELRTLGWRCLTVWECELRNPDAVENRLRRFVGDAVARLPSGGTSKSSKARTRRSMGKGLAGQTNHRQNTRNI